MPDFLKQCGGYTPIPDALVREYGLATAQTWGAVWRFCQGEKGLCDASNETIAERAGVSHRSVCDYLKRLTADGFIEDLDPGIRNRPHRLKVEAGEDKIIGMRNLHTSTEQAIYIAPEPEPEPTAEPAAGMQDLPTLEGEGMQILHSGYAGFADPGMQDLHKKRESKRESKTYLKTPPLEEIQPGPLTTSILETCCIDLSMLTNGSKGDFLGLIKIFSKRKVQPQEVLDFRLWWDEYDWRGQKGQPPTLKQLGESWKLFKNGKLPGKEQRNGHNQQRRNGQNAVGDAAKAERDAAAIRQALDKRSRAAPGALNPARDAPVCG